MLRRLAFPLALGACTTAVLVVGTAGAAPVPPRTPLCLAVPDSVPGDAAVINITNTAATGNGYGALRPSDATPIPEREPADQYSSVNFAPGSPDPNLAITTIGADGEVCYDSDGATANVILDLVATIPSGVIDAGSGPQRLVDTRTTDPVRPRTPLCLDVPGTPGDTVFINITNTAASGNGYGALRPSDATPIPALPPEDQYSSVNFAPGPANPNLAITTTGPDGRICYDSDGATANVILDLVATIPSSPDFSTGGLRLIDTRTTSRVRPRTPLCVDAGVDLFAGDALIINITNTDATGNGYGAVRPSDATPIPSRPAEDQYSSVNFAPGPANPNLAVTTVGPDDRICYDSDGATANVILDLVAIVGRDSISIVDPDRLVDTRPEPAPGPAPDPGAPPVPEVPPPAPAGSFAFIFTNRRGEPARWNPCQPITFQTNMSGATPGQAAAFREAVVDAERATGIDFVDVGTFEGGSDDRFPNSGADAFFGVYPSNTPALNGAAGRAGTFISGRNEIVAATGTIAAEISDVQSEAVWLHEIGHVLGLDHVNDGGQVMFPFTGPPFTDYSVGDLNGLYELGAAQGCLNGTRKVDNATKFQSE